MTDPYNAKVRELFADTAHAGDLEDAPTGWYEDQGIKVRLAATVDNGELAFSRLRLPACHRRLRVDLPAV